METKPLKQSVDFKRIGIAIIIFIGAVLVMAIFLGSDSSEKKESPKQKEMNLELRRSVTEKDFSGQVLTVKNLNSIEWEDCEVTINDDYRKNVSGIFLPSKLATTEDNRGYMIFPVGGFTKSDGTYFDAKRQAILKATIACRKPYISAYAGSFNQ